LGSKKGTVLYYVISEENRNKILTKGIISFGLFVYENFRGFEYCYFYLLAYTLVVFLVRNLYNSFSNDLLKKRKKIKS